MATIDGFILQNKKFEASEFLGKFSKLIRQVLENSQHSLITIEKELEALTLYIELEEVRHNHSFSHTIFIDPELIKESYRIPPLIFQPYVENAILHGLRHLNANDGLLEMELHKINNQLMCIIRDNGIGMKKSEEINRLQPKNHQSMGLKFTGLRIETLNTGFKNRASVETSDASEALNSGTIVKIYLPLII